MLSLAVFETLLDQQMLYFTVFEMFQECHYSAWRAAARGPRPADRVFPVLEVSRIRALRILDFRAAFRNPDFSSFLGCIFFDVWFRPLPPHHPYHKKKEAQSSGSHPCIARGGLRPLLNDPAMLRLP